MKNRTLLLALIIVFNFPQSKAQNTSIANVWNEMLIESIRKDFARPPVHSRNLYHLSIAMYDAWAVYDPSLSTHLLGKTLGNFTASYTGVPMPTDITMARQKAISYAAYRLIKHRFANSPGVSIIYNKINNLMDSLGYDINYTSTSYLNGNPAAMGNYIANRIIAYGYQDGSNEINNYAYQYYTPVNPKILVEQPGNPTMIDPNHWQPISLSVAIDQAGNVLTSDPPHLGPEWGNVNPFALADSVLTTHNNNGNNFKVYHDQDDPPYLDTTVNGSGLSDFFKWNFSMVSVWQSHLDTTDGVLWDISPASQGNNTTLPNNWGDYASFYKFFDGGDAGVGYTINPVTNQAYTPQMVKRGDYARVLAEFWADGLDSETPPGHWFKIYNQISDHPLYEKKWGGQGPLLDDLEYDVKAYLTMGGAMHDAAIAAWSHKGWYDYVRPVSAIRYMADQGQSSDTSAANYSPAGLPLLPGFIELVQLGDTLAGTNNEHVGKIKLYTWRGPSYIQDPETDMSGVGWILAENWWPYQRPTFVSPPFAGYVSGHSTFSRAAAEIMTSITGTAYFPGGMSNFVAAQNDFLHFEEGPSQEIILQWATYRDASDQCSLSRIWGGIHPPIDDIPGRKIGLKVGNDAYLKADLLYSQDLPLVQSVSSDISVINIASIGDTLHVSFTYNENMDTTINPVVTYLNTYHPLINSLSVLNAHWISPTVYQVAYSILAYSETMNDVIVQIKGAKNLLGKTQNVSVTSQPFRIDKESPIVLNCNLSNGIINDSVCGGSFSFALIYNESCDTSSTPAVSFIGNTSINNCLTTNSSLSGWINDSTYLCAFDAMDNNEILDSIGIMISGSYDMANNTQLMYADTNILVVDTKNALLNSYTINDSLLTTADIGSQALIIDLIFDKAMDQSMPPQLFFSTPNLIGNGLTLNSANTTWVDSIHCTLTYNLQNIILEEFQIGIQLSSIKDMAGNSPLLTSIDSLFSIDTKKPLLVSVTPLATTVADVHAGNGQFTATVQYDEKMDLQQLPVLELFHNGSLMSSITYNIFGSSWTNDTLFNALFNVVDLNEDIENINLTINFGKDASGNGQVLESEIDWINLDTKNPDLLVLSANGYLINSSSTDFELIGVFDEAINTINTPVFDFIAAQNVNSFLSFDAPNSVWLNSTTYQASYSFPNTTFIEPQINIVPSNIFDMAGNALVTDTLNNFFAINYEPLGIKNINENSSFSLFPNPLALGATLQLISSDNSIKEIEIYSIDGKLLFREPVVNSKQMIQLPDFSAGIYIVVAKANDALYEQKLMITQ
jgi:hypothetical protein